MPTMDWDKLRVFRGVAEAGSFTHAGEVLNLSQSAVSRQVSALEDSLGVPLFHRHARGLVLTEQGEILYRTAREVFAKLAAAEARISESRERPSGTLTITTTVAFGSVWLTPRICDFIELYPDIDLHLLLSDTEVDLSMRQADIAIRMAPPRQPDLITRHLFSVRTHIYASPAYIQHYGLPRTVEDLDHHRIIVFGTDVRPPVPEINWLTQLGAQGRRSSKARQPVLTVNNIYANLQAVRAGLGLASLPEYIAQGEANLVKVLPELKGPLIEGHFVYPEELRHSKRVEVFRDFLLRKVAEAHF